MTDNVGLSKSELEHIARWMMRKTPSDQSDLAKQTIGTVIELIVRNNEAITNSLNDALPTDSLPDEGF